MRHHKIIRGTQINSLLAFAREAELPKEKNKVLSHAGQHLVLFHLPKTHQGGEQDGYSAVARKKKIPEFLSL